MKIVLSDFHLGSPLFKRSNKIIKLFNKPEVDEIYILGDFLDTWEKDIEVTVEENKEFISFLNNCKKIKVMLKGNHDPDIDTLKKIFYNLPVLVKYDTEIMGKKVVMVHGDEFDSDLGWMTKLFFIHFILQRVGINIKALFLSVAYRVIRLVKGLKKNDLVFNAEKKIFNGYKKDYDVVIAGHTHIPKLYKDSEGTYLNCGSIISKPSYIEIEGGVAKVKRLK